MVKNRIEFDDSSGNHWILEASHSGTEFEIVPPRNARPGPGVKGLLSPEVEEHIREILQITQNARRRGRKDG